MKISILDDYFDTLRTLDCFRKLDGYDVRSGTTMSRASMPLQNGCATPRCWF